MQITIMITTTRIQSCNQGGHKLNRDYYYCYYYDNDDDDDDNSGDNDMYIEKERPPTARKL